MYFAAGHYRGGKFFELHSHHARVEGLRAHATCVGKSRKPLVRVIVLAGRPKLANAGLHVEGAVRHAGADRIALSCGRGWSSLATVSYYHHTPFLSNLNLLVA